MTNATPLQPFTFAAGMTIRALRTPEGAPWFIATDVAQALGYRDAANMTRLLDDDEKGTQIVSTIRGNQSVTTISESGLYSAIFSSSKAEAKAFKKWVTGTVLPSLRKNDAYAVGAEYLPQATQAALYKEIRGKVNAALRLHDRATEHDHFKSPRKQAERSLEASREVAAATGLPLAVVIATASYGGVKGAEVLALLTAP
jgi:prophage antirepressor-like protein